LDGQRRGSWRIPAILAAAALAPAGGALAVDVGQVIENEELPALAGGRERLLGDGKASVFVFVRPHHEHSTDALRQMAACEKELAGKPIHWVAVVSGSAVAAEVSAMVKETGIRMPVLVDQGDALYSRLGVRLHPLVGVADGSRRLVAWQPYLRLNYCEVIKARVRFLLGEITQAQLDAVIAPPRATMPGEDRRFVARRDLNLGRMFLERQAWQKALDSARKALERDPSCGEARTLAGQALAGMERCAEAAIEFDAALALDPRDAAAAEGKRGCSR
jgi:tetratricopeptide (TPR) repeat protein